jgi:hypothetical protein
MPPSEFYHGTSLDAALTIQQTGFCVGLSGTNAGAMLGNGVYMTTTLEKALNYAKDKPHGGIIFQLRVDLGRCKKMSRADPMMKTWHEKGYDSAWSPAGVNGVREENCVRDASRIQITNAIFGNTGEADRHGYRVRDCKVERFETAAMRKERQRKEQQERQRREQERQRKEQQERQRREQERQRKEQQERQRREHEERQRKEQEVEWKRKENLDRLRREQEDLLAQKIAQLSGVHEGTPPPVAHAAPIHTGGESLRSGPPPHPKVTRGSSINTDLVAPAPAPAPAPDDAMWLSGIIIILGGCIYPTILLGQWATNKAGQRSCAATPSAPDGWNGFLQDECCWAEDHQVYEENGCDGKNLGEKIGAWSTVALRLGSNYLPGFRC